MFWPLSVHYIFRAERSLISNFLPLIKIHQKYFSISWVGGDIPHVQSAEDWREMETPNLCKSEIKQTLEKHRGHTATKSVIKTNTNNPRGRNFRDLWYDTRADDKISSRHATWGGHGHEGVWWRVLRTFLSPRAKTNWEWSIDRTNRWNKGNHIFSFCASFCLDWTTEELFAVMCSLLDLAKIFYDIFIETTSFKVWNMLAEWCVYCVYRIILSSFIFPRPIRFDT